MRPLHPVTSFLEQFFGEGNAIKWSEVQNSSPSSSIRAALEPWIKRAEQGASPLILPRVYPSTNQTAWYVICTDSREARSIRESLLAFVGPTYSTFNGELATLGDTDAIDQLCEQNYGSLVFRLPIVASKDRGKVNELLGKLIEFRERESARSVTTVKPVGRLLRDLEMAILASNEESAWAIYAEIRSRGRLSATNLTFLQVRIHGAFERWAELVLLPNLNDLLQVRRPRRVSDQIAQAVYHHFLGKPEIEGRAEKAIGTYRSTVQRYQNLVKSVESLHSPEAVKLALVAAVGDDPPRVSAAKQIAEHKALADDQGWVNELLDRLPVDTESKVEKVAEVAVSYNLAEAKYNENDFGSALKLYLGQSPSYQTVCRVLETAVEVDSPHAAEQALAYLSSAPDEIGGQVLGRRVCENHIEFLSRIVGSDDQGEIKEIKSFQEWFEFIDNSEKLDNALEVLEYGISEWLSDSNTDPQTVADGLTRSRVGKQAVLVRNAIPKFIKALFEGRSASRGYKPIYNSILELLIYDESVGSDDLVVVEQLTEAILTTAPSHESGNNDFAFAVEITTHLWETLAGPRHFDWVLSMLDLQIDCGAQQHASLTPVLASICEKSRLWARRISEDQWNLLDLLASDLSLQELVSDLRPNVTESSAEDQPEIRGALVGKSIAVYSLTERIARRFGQLAEQAFDGIKIHYIHDKALTDRMKSLSRSADIFIVNTWDAKHAATNGIKFNRSGAAITLEPEGKSAASLFRCLGRYADSSVKGVLQ